VDGAPILDYFNATTKVAACTYAFVRASSPPVLTQAYMDTAQFAKLIFM